MYQKIIIISIFFLTRHGSVNVNIVNSDQTFVKTNALLNSLFSSFIKTFILTDVYSMLERKDFDTVSLILFNDPNIINSLRKSSKNETLMMRAAADHRKDCIEFLSSKPHDLSVVDNECSNIFHYIVWMNEDDIAVEMLNCLNISQIENDVINQRDINNHTPFHHAAARNRKKSIDWLFNNGSLFYLI